MSLEPQPYVDRPPREGDLVDLDPLAEHGMRVIEETPEQQAQRGISNLSRLVAVHQGDPSGDALYKAIRALDLNDAQGLLMLAVVGIADGSHG